MDEGDLSALQALVELANSMLGRSVLSSISGIGAASPRVPNLRYVRFEGDIEGTEFTVLGFSAGEAAQKAVAEAQRRREALGR